ncbi:Mitotic spindle checkpoint component mad2 [Kluyveromyces marxianus]|nr:Mitotic spindle checkpoint component mad2 [Kluyveromyces marxianus]KAG0679227.1 Mitotic spindle checkpoint component mad2 [Kluyveromyces marxianus]
MEAISLKGSTRIITEFFEYSLNSILYQRAVYPAEDFTTVKKYDLSLLKTVDTELKQYIRTILQQVHRWLLGGKCHKLVLCIVDKDDGETIERWDFNVNGSENTNGEMQENIEVPLEETQKEIRALLRQITASVTFLPELKNEKNYTFNVLAYTDSNAHVPMEWTDAESKDVEDGEAVQFKSFKTSNYSVGAQVTYKF